MHIFKIKNIRKALALMGMVTNFCLFLFAGCKNPSRKADSPVAPSGDNTVTLSEAQLKNAPITVTSLSEKSIAMVLKLNGKVDVPPQSQISVSVPLGGYLKSTKLLPGMRVRKGELIAVMEDPQYVRLQQDYLQAKSKLHFATLDYERQKELNEGQASSDKIMQQAQTEMSVLRIQMNALAQQLRLINIDPDKLTEKSITRSAPVYSSINGFVSKVNVNIGKYVNPSEVLFELINPDDIHLNLVVYEKDISKLRIGQKLKAYTNAAPDTVYDGEIILISKDVSANGVSEVHCHFIHYNKALLPGMYMNAEIEIQSSFANALPDESVVSFEGKDYVFEETGKLQYKMVPVIIGEKENGYLQVLNADELAGKSVVCRNAYTLLMKLKNTGNGE